jgi:hypothetical protein
MHATGGRWRVVCVQTWVTGVRSVCEGLLFFASAQWIGQVISWVRVNYLVMTLNAGKPHRMLFGPGLSASPNRVSPYIDSPHQAMSVEEIICVM